MKFVSVMLIVILFIVNLIQPSLSHALINTLPGFPGKLPFKLETGYVGIGEREDLQLFYYFVESERNPTDDPLVIWITGGPGFSALGAFFYQLGPLKFDYANSNGKIPQLEVNPYSWTKVASVIFVDASGSGFSYAKTKEAYKTSDTLTSASIYEFLRKWVQNHPKFLNNPLYVAGVSYSGIQVPVIIQNIFNGNEAGNSPRLNIKGYMCGNPLTDRDIDFNSRIPYAHQFALLSDEIFESAKSSCNGNYINVDTGNGLCLNALNEVDECLKNIYYRQILEPKCVSDRTTIKRIMLQQQDHENPYLSQLRHWPKSWCRDDNYEYSTTWARDKTVQKALRTREGTIKEWRISNTDHYVLGRNDTDTYKYDITSSLVYHRNLTKKHCRALVYSGDHDLVFPYVGTRKWIHTLGLKAERRWTPWFVNKQVAGYTETFSKDEYSLTFATVKGAGHTAPEYKPEESLAMADRWFANTLL